MSPTKKTLSALGAAALVFTMGACGTAGATSDGNDAASGNRPASPLNQIMDQVWGTSLSQEEQQRRLDEQNLRQQELIAQCMNEKGFDYTPNPNSGGTVIVGDDGMWRPDDREWVAEWGYGAVNSPWNAQWEAEQAAREEAGEDLNQWFDPNQELWDTMSETEMQAWQEALWGPPLDWDDPTLVSPEGEILDMERFNANRGCSGDAWNTIDAESPWSLTQSEEFQPLMDAMNEMHMNLTNDPQWIAIDRDWATCMANAGHAGFNSQGDAQNSIWEQWSEIQNGIDWNAWDWEANPSGPNARNLPEAQALAEREIELALTDLDCRVSTNVTSRREAVQFAAENQFINDHRAALDALVAAAVQRG